MTETPAKYKTSEPPLTLEQFEEKTKRLQEVYDNNIKDLARVFLEKVSRFWARLSDADKAIIVKRRHEAMSEAAKKLPGSLIP